MWFLLPLFVFLWAAPGQATVFFNETFDDGESAIQSRWAASCGVQWLRSGIFSLDSSQHVSGTSSMKQVVNGLTTRTPEYLSGTCFIDKEFLPTQNLFVRWYERTQAGFTYDASNVKTINFGSNYYPSWWIGHWDGNQQSNLGGQVVADHQYENPTYYHNRTPMVVPVDRWVCMEVQLSVNTRRPK